MIVPRVFKSRQRKRKNISIVLSSQKRSIIFDASFFDVKKRDSKKAIRRIATVRRTVAVPACVPKKALAFNGRVSPSAPKKEVSFSTLPFFDLNRRDENKAIRRIETVRWTVSMPACVPKKACSLVHRLCSCPYCFSVCKSGNSSQI